MRTKVVNNNANLVVVVGQHAGPEKSKSQDAWGEITKSGRQKLTISLRSSIVLLSLFSIVSVALVSVTPSYYFGISAVNDISDQLQEQTVDRIQQEIQLALNIPHDALRSFELTYYMMDLERNGIDCDNLGARYATMGIVEKSDVLSQAYIGYQDGGITGVVKDLGTVSYLCGARETKYNMDFTSTVTWESISIPFSQFDIVDSVKGYKAAVEKKGPTWSPVYSSFTTGGLILAITAVRPIFNDLKNSRIIGVGGIEMNLNLIQEKLKSIRISKNGLAFILQKDGNIIGNTLGVPVADEEGNMIHYKHSNNTLMIKSAKHLEKDGTNQLRAIDGIGRFNLKDGDTEYLVFTSTLTIVVIIPRKDIFSKVDKMIIMSSSLTAGLFVVILILNILVSTYIISDSLASIIVTYSPLNAVAKAMQKISTLDFENQIHVDSSSSLQEIQIIQASFNIMDATLKSFGKYVPMTVVQRIVEGSKNQGQLFLDRRNATVMFTDIEGFTSLSGLIPTESLVEVLSDYLEEVSTIIIDTGGTVVDFIGDAIVAIWNAPNDVPDHAMNACVCAVRYMRAMQGLNTRWMSKGLVKLPLKVRIGINTGLVYVGNIGSTKRMKYDVIGNTMNFVFKLEGLNSRYQTGIIISDETRQCIHPRMLYRPLEYLAVNEKTNFMQVHELLADTQESSDREILSAKSKIGGSGIISGFKEMNESQRSEVIMKLKEYCEFNVDDTPMRMILEFMKFKDYDGITVIEDD